MYVVLVAIDVPANSKKEAEGKVDSMFDFNLVGIESVEVKSVTEMY